MLLGVGSPRVSLFWRNTNLWCKTIIRPKTLLICGEDLFFLSPSAFGLQTALIYVEDLILSPSAIRHNFHRSLSLLRKRHMAKGDTAKPRSGCQREIPSREPQFLATSLACCFESLRIKRNYDVYYRYRADVIHYNLLMIIPTTVTSWMSARSFWRENKII